MRTILCPIDFSTSSRKAMHVAARVARANHARLLLLHSWHVPPIEIPTEAPPHAVQQVVEEAMTGLASAAKEAHGLGAEQVETALQTGLPAEQILDAANDPAVDLIVMGSRGRTGLSRLLLGSVAENVLRHAPCPVLIARGDPASFARALCAVDFSNNARDSLTLAAQLVRTDGTLTLLHVVEPPITYIGQPEVADRLGEIDRRCSSLLEDWASGIRTSGRTTVTRVEVGNPTGQILAALDEEPHYDLVAVGHRGRTGLSRFLLGSVAEKVARHAPCSVLVSRSRS